MIVLHELKSNLVTVKKTIEVLMVCVILSACSVTPKQSTPVEVKTRVQQDVAQMYVDQESISAPLTLEMAVARTLKYNLDYRLKKMESAMALGIADLSKYDMWPQLLSSAGYNSRSNLSGGTSIGIEDGIESLRASTSQQRHIAQLGAEFSWNVLDFGVSYYQAKKNADQYLVAEERRRKLVQNMMQDVRAAYWRALGAQNLEQEAQEILTRADKALLMSREAESQKIISPDIALNYQRTLLDATTLLNQRRQDLAFAKRELAALMSVPPGQDFTLAQATETALPPVINNIEALEEMALLQRPELREEDYQKRITAAEAKKQLLSFLPNLNLGTGFKYDSNDYLYNNTWSQASVGVTWNLLKLFSLPTMKDNQQQQVKLDEARRLALSMAILTQLRISAERYKLAVKDYEIADTAADVDQRLATYTEASVSAKLENELEVVRTKTRAVLGAYQRANAYANAQIAYGRLYNTLGFDALEDNFEGDDLKTLATRIHQHFTETENSKLTMKSNLFDAAEFAPPKSPYQTVNVKINGVNNPALSAKMQQSLVALFARHDIDVSDQGLPLTFALRKEDQLNIDHVKWYIILQHADGSISHSTRYTTKMPQHSRDSIIEATLIAAATANLKEIQGWLK